jgi:acyl carrier protein
MLRLVTEVEREIGRPIDDDDLVLKNFDTLSAIEALIARYRQRTAQSTLAARQ